MKGMADSAAAPARQMVYPSGALFAAASTPVSPPAPPRVSTTTCWPSSAESPLASERPNRSAAPPAANGTISLSGRFGNGCAPAAGGSSAAAARAEINARRVGEVAMCSPSRSSRFQSGRRGRPRQPEVIAQRGARIVAPEQAAPLQLGDDEVDEIVERARKIRGHDDEPVRHAAGEPLLELVGEALGRTGDHPMPARGGGDIIEIAQRHLLAPRHLQERARKGLAALGLLGKLRNWSVQRIARDVVPDPLRDERDRVGGGEPALQARELLLRVLVALAD